MKRIICREHGNIYSLILIFILLFTCDNTINGEPLTIGVSIGSALAAGAFIGGYQYLKCKIYECCEKPWLMDDFSGMRTELNKRVYGQHLVQQTVVAAVKAHLENDRPRKALTLSFHGWTGGGKNFVANILLKYLYRKGVRSDFVHLFVGGLHFAHADSTAVYQKQLRSWIRGNVSACSRNLFIFDELDKTNVQVIDTIKPFIDHHSHLDNVDYRKSIFIFISNTGGNDITQRTLEYYQSGKPREKISLHEMEEIITVAAYNEEGGLRFSNLINSHLIDHFVPFLPLEREHILMCIRDYLTTSNDKKSGRKTKNKYYNSNNYYPREEIVNKIADSMQYFPKSTQIYSASGCKRVAQKTELVIQEESDFEDDSFFRDDL